MREENYVLSEESAREQFDLLLDFYDVDLLRLDKTGEFKDLVESKLIKAIRQGKVEIENGEKFLVKQTLRNGKEIVYKELNGMAKVHMERFKERHERLYGLLAILSGKRTTDIQQISGSDVSIAEYLGTIFLAG